MMSVKRFSLSWLAASIVMFTISYAWHGIVLNDFIRLNYPKSIFLVFAALMYIIIGFVVVKVVDTKTYDHLFTGQIMKGLVKGAFCGFVFFLIAIVVGISFSKATGIKHLAVDIAWQMIEQGIGGVVVMMVYMATENSFFWKY